MSARRFRRCFFPSTTVAVTVSPHVKAAERNAWLAGRAVRIDYPSLNSILWWTSEGRVAFPQASRVPILTPGETVGDGRRVERLGAVHPRRYKGKVGGSDDETTH